METRKIIFRKGVHIILLLIFWLAITYKLFCDKSEDEMIIFVGKPIPIEGK